MVWGILPIWHLPTGLLLTDFCCLDFSWLGLDICWLRHLLISANLPFADYTWTFADPDICWSFLYPPIKTFADQDIYWFYQKSHLLTFFFKILFPSLLSFLVSFVAFPQFFPLLHKCSKSFLPNLYVFSRIYQKLFQILFFNSKFHNKTSFRCSKFIYVEFFLSELSSWLQYPEFFALCTIHMNGPWFFYF